MFPNGKFPMKLVVSTLMIPGLPLVVFVGEAKALSIRDVLRDMGSVAVPVVVDHIFRRGSSNQGELPNGSVPGVQELTPMQEGAGQDSLFSPTYPSPPMQFYQPPQAEFIPPPPSYPAPSYPIPQSFPQPYPQYYPPAPPGFFPAPAYPPPGYPPAYPNYPGYPPQQYRQPVIIIN